MLEHYTTFMCSCAHCWGSYVHKANDKDSGRCPACGDNAPAIVTCCECEAVYEWESDDDSGRCVCCRCRH